MRSRAERRYDPFLDGHLHVAGDDDRRRLRLLGEVCREIAGYGRPLIGRQIDHRADQRVPALSRVPARIGNLIERVALGAGGLHRVLARALGQLDWLAATLRAGRHRRNIEDGKDRNSRNGQRQD